MIILVIKLLIIFMLVFFSMVFSGSEIAIASLDASGVLKEEDTIFYKKFHKLVDIWSLSPLRILNAILIGNNIVLMLITVVNTNLSFNFANLFNMSLSNSLFILTIFTTIIVISFGEIIPKILGRLYPEKFFKFSYNIIVLFDKMILPLNKILSKFTLWTVDIFGLDLKKKTTLTTDSDVEEFLTILETDGAIKKDEKNVIESIIDFSDIRANEMMFPREKMDCINIDSGFDNIVKEVIRLKHSRIPVYKDTIDNIVGILYAKDLFIELCKKDTFNIERILRKPYFIPLTKKINELFREFRKGHHHMAIVINEYGTLQGMVTIEDILEEILGDILDEYDKEEYKLEKIRKNTYITDGDIELEILSNKIGLEFDENIIDENVRTLSGYILFVLGRFPSKDEIIKTKKATFKIKEIHKKIIKKVTIKKD